ncbi:patatin-like phospholipase family protein [Pelomonas sp. KK5]|uniref:patatin-like phospholipase family protein n=1 Tax=Pelomonas sp. KK5 TaxID=1855730 RepID=UPI00097BAA75|nr:patatin-like phospholipase family protein [Pelomonas sp. KK5]
MRAEAGRRFRRLVIAALLAPCLASAADGSSTSAQPRLGLVLSGGGARGLAHVGVLKVMEREHIPVDLIAGTSMGAIIGGLYASGMSARDLERELLLISWDNIFAARVARQELSQRRKEEDFEFSAVLELGMRNGEIRAPQGTVSSRGLEILLRRLTLPVRSIDRFDALATPFRAVATNMETGGQVVLADGDLALAMRSSMSVPGVFAPTETHDQILGDGGLVNNLPIDVARRMGATRVIAVNVGTPLAGRETLNSVLGLTSQMISILTEQNVQRSIASLDERDLLITPALDKLTSGDFAKTREMIAAGEAAAEAMLPQLRAFAVPPLAYADWQLQRTRQAAGSPRLAAIAFEGSEITHPERIRDQLESKPGQPFDTARAERDARLLASSGDYERVDYHVEPTPQGDTLVFAMEDKTWGPNYFRVGLDLSTDFAGDSAFNLRVSHNRHWLTDSGTEWRNQVTIGQTPRLYSEIYQPLGFKLGPSNDWFVSAWGDLERRNIDLYDASSGDQLARLGRKSLTLGADIGQPWGRLGEVRLGLVHQEWRINPTFIVSTLADTTGVFHQRWQETGIRLRVVIDQLDYANFPQSGYRIEFEATDGQQNGGATVRHASFNRTELQATQVSTWGANTLNLHGRALVARQPDDSAQGPYSLGGFQQLSGYKPGQLTGNALAFARATYYRRMFPIPVLSRGFFVGGSLETGNTWNTRRDASTRDLRWASSLFVGTDTGIGPLYLALGRAQKSDTAIYLFIGRP